MCFGVHMSIRNTVSIRTVTTRGILWLRVRVRVYLVPGIIPEKQSTYTQTCVVDVLPLYQVPGYSRVLPAPPILVTGTSSTQYSPCIWAPGTREYLGTAPGIRVPTGSPWEPRGWQLIMPQFMPPPQYLVQSNFKFKEGQPILLPFCQQFGSSRVPGYLPAVSP